MDVATLMDQNISWNDELYHHGVKGMKWGVRKAYQSATRSLGGSRFASKAINNSKYLDSKGKKQALDENAYLAAKKKSKKTGGDVTYDTTTGKYNVSKEVNKKGLSSKQKKAIGVTSTLAVATAAAALYKKNPAVKKLVNEAAKKSVTAFKKESAKAISKGKHFVAESAKSAARGVKEGFKEGMKEAPKNATKTVLKGAALLATKRALDRTVGKKESTRIFQANNSKKIDKFWKVYEDDED